MRHVAILLCAGFGTRMGDLVAETPKPLLPVAGRPVIDYLFDQIVELPSVDAVHVVTNSRHIDAFRNWARDRRRHLGGRPLVAHDDGALDNAGRRGAVGDLGFVLERLEHPVDGALVAAGDNIFRFSIAPLWRRRLERRATQVLALAEPDRERLRRTGVLELEGDRVVHLHEKPRDPPSTWACPPLYALDAGTLERVGPYLAEGRPADEIGRFIADLATRRKIEAWRVDGRRLDIGSPESYAAADALLRAVAS